MNFSDYFYYDNNTTSCLRWKFSKWAGRGLTIPVFSKGDSAGYKHGSGYWHVKINGKSYTVHRIVNCLFNPDFMYNCSELVDHLDGNLDNNRISNLKVVTTAVNNRNSKQKKNNKTGVNGVYFCTITEIDYYRAQVNAFETKKSKAFSVKKFGKATAFQMACDWRAMEIEKLKAHGIHYSERHGEEVLDEATKQAKIKAGSINEKKE